MPTVAVIAHQAKRLGGGLPALRACLAGHGVTEPLWAEVPKSRKAPARVTEVLEAGADLVLAWGGDGMVQRCADVLAGTGVPLGVLPAGTANLLANNLGIPIDLDGAVEVALHGARRALDVGRANGERFAVMAGCGFDAEMIAGAGRGLKDRLGRLSYVWTGAKATTTEARRVTVDVDGVQFFEGDATCVLVGNVGTISGGLPAFPEASPLDGRLDVGVVTARGPLQWSRVLGALATKRASRSPFASTTTGATIDVRLDRKTTLELDGGERGQTKRLTVEVEPKALVVCVPDGGGR